ncbi:MAG TPA: MFS transporter [Thermomicrobiales bacterium]|jgi:DHA2 family multidrug resistance protein-like MFS transporter
MTHTDTTSLAGARAGRREWLGLLVLALACLIYAMDLTVLHLALPTISEQLRPSSAQLLWIVDIYGFLVAGALITMGTLGDRIGRRKLLLFGAAAFGAISILAAFSTSAGMLIASRALLGLAGATVAPSTLSLIFSMFHDRRQRATAIGVWIAAFSAGGAIGPVLGGVLLEHFWWGSVFLLAVPPMALLLVLGPRLLPEYRDASAGRLDLISAALSLTAILAMIFGLKELAQGGTGWLTGAPILLGLIAGVAFVRRQLTLAEPMIDVRLFRHTAFSVSLSINFLGVFVSVGYFLFVAQYLQLVLGLSPLESGLWSLPSAAGFIVGSQLAPLIGRRVRPALVIGTGLAAAAVGLVVLLGVQPSGGLAPLVLSSLVISLGLAPVLALTTDLIVGSVPPERAGAASGLSETCAELGGALGIAILGSIGVAVYRNALTADLPTGLTPETTAAARDTLGAAVGVAEQLPGGTGAALLVAAREAFVQGMHLATAIAAVIAVAAAILAVTLLRHVRPNDATPHEPPDEPTAATVRDGDEPAVRSQRAAA